jgi:transcriptional regulator with XRE-family HTH domain
MLKNDTSLNIDNRIRTHLKRLRTERKLTQRDLGIIAGVPHVHQIEAGDTPAGKQVVMKLAKALNVDPGEFYRPIIPVGNHDVNLQRLLNLMTPAGKSHLLRVAKSIVEYERQVLEEGG